ncbi:uncharacterized protein Bfra_003380 [Botrytis fragariae]|uniref:Uncharacterized protein n=1 Tax=Botrytis fragariae TaxID=1964551 RepID=A0A8H6AWL9_9HELO|nr:uncharacterized protein Bfra_003380 [Botrytis fragariae]KAF5874927.1 hypothetical protein Bfra_003380 [Botrytis fragariae]
MSPSPSPESNDTLFPDSHIPRPSEDIDMQSVPENTTYNTAGGDTPSSSPAPFVQRQIQSFLQRRAIERAENPDLVEPRSVRATNTTVNSTDLSAPSSSSQRRQLRINNAVRAMARDLGILTPDAMDTHLPTIAEEARAVATSGLDSSSRAREIRRARRHRRPENQSRRQDITRRNRRPRRNAMDAVSGRPVSTSPLYQPSFETLLSRSNRTSNVDADDEAVDMDPPLPDPAMSLDTFTARRNVRSRSALSNVMSTSDMEYENQEMYSVNTDPSYNSATLPGNMQPRGCENSGDQRGGSALHTFTTPGNADSPSVASTCTSTSRGTTEPQTRSQATGTGNTTVSSRKPSQNATVRLWGAMYPTNDRKQQDRERVREQGVDDIPISKLSIAGPSQRWNVTDG